MLRGSEIPQTPVHSGDMWLERHPNIPVVPMSSICSGPESAVNRQSGLA